MLPVKKPVLPKTQFLMPHRFFHTKTNSNQSKSIDSFDSKQLNILNNHLQSVTNDQQIISLPKKFKLIGFTQYQSINNGFAWFFNPKIMHSKALELIRTIHMEAEQTDLAMFQLSRDVKCKMTDFTKECPAYLINTNDLDPVKLLQTAPASSRPNLTK